MKTSIAAIVLLMIAILAAGCFTGSDAGYEAVFNNMETALRNKDKSLFEKQWTVEGFNQAIARSSGMSGKEVFEEGSGEGWFPKPDYSKNTALGDAIIVETEIWSIEKEKSIDEVYFLLKKEKGEWKIAGGGEDINEVKSAGNNG